MNKYPALHQNVWAITSARVDKRGIVMEIIKDKDGNQDNDQYIVQMIGIPMTLRFKLTELSFGEEEWR